MRNTRTLLASFALLALAATTSQAGPGPGPGPGRRVVVGGPVYAVAAPAPVYVMTTTVYAAPVAKTYVARPAYVVPARRYSARRAYRMGY